METRQLHLGDFSFLIEKDVSSDPVSGVAVWVLFRDEPCCDDNGHQYRFYLPLAVSNDTVADVCQAFTLAIHCEQLGIAA